MLRHILGGADISVDKVYFDDFYDIVIERYKKLTKPDKSEFKKEISTYFCATSRKNVDWNEFIPIVLGKTKYEFDWYVLSDLAELLRGNGDTDRAIARYYYLHSLSNNCLTACVDNVLFKDDDDYNCCADVFEKTIIPEVIEEDADNTDWRASSNYWNLVATPNKPFNGHLASVAFKSEKNGTTFNPLDMAIQVDLTNVLEPDSGVELYFNTVSVVSVFEKLSNENIEYLEPEGKAFRIGGTDNFRKIYLSARNNTGLCGEYQSDSIIRVHPKRGAYDFTVSLNLSLLNTNLIPPDDLELDTKEKRGIIKRMVAKQVLPEPDSAGNVLLHEVQYKVTTKKRTKR